MSTIGESLKVMECGLVTAEGPGPSVCPVLLALLITGLWLKPYGQVLVWEQLLYLGG